MAQPVPGPQRPLYCLNVSIAPTHRESGEEREVDDWKPTINDKVFFDLTGELSLFSLKTMLICADFICSK